MSFGSEYRTPTKINMNKVAKQTHDILGQFIKKYKGQYAMNMNMYCQRSHANNADAIGNPPKVQYMIKELQNKYIIAHADKAASNLVIMCPKYYVENICNAICVRIDNNNAVRIQGNDVYKPTTHTRMSHSWPGLSNNNHTILLVLFRMVLEVWYCMVMVSF